MLLKKFFPSGIMTMTFCFFNKSWYVFLVLCRLNRHWRWLFLLWWCLIILNADFVSYIFALFLFEKNWRNLLYEKVGLVFQDVVAGMEVINCQSVKLQVNWKQSLRAFKKIGEPWSMIILMVEIENTSFIAYSRLYVLFILMVAFVSYVS